MFIKFGGVQIYDFDLELMRGITGVLDTQLARLRRWAEECEDPDGFGVYDTWDCSCGMGFVAIQRYLTSTCNCLGLEKTNKNLNHGPMHSGGQSIAIIANATTNY